MRQSNNALWAWRVKLGLVEIDDSPLAAVENERPEHMTLQNVSDRHHALARALASGMKTKDAAFAVGLTPGRVSVLKKDPLFEDLLKSYQEGKLAAQDRVAEKFMGLTGAAAEELQRRMEEDPMSFTNQDLMDLATRMGDRSGYAPVSKSVNLSATVDMSEKLAEARERARQAVVEVTDGT